MSNAGSPTAEAVPSNPPSSSWQDHPIAITVAALAGAVALAGILYLAGAFETGDEPPIRVKNGSLELYLASSGERWKQQEDPKHWKISGGKRAKDPLDVAIALNPAEVNVGTTPCTAQAGTGDPLILTYSNGTSTLATITIKSTPNGKRTLVESTADLSLSSVDPKNRLLTYSTDGFISRIVLGTNTMCTFTKKEQLAELVIMDY